MSLRQPFRAGSFYEADETACRNEAQRLLTAVALPKDLPPGMVGGIAPHAGWLYSGAVAATTLKALATQHTPAAVVLFGADHFGTASAGEVFNCGAWVTPLGELPIDEPLADALVAADERLTANCPAHVREHSLEVLAPLLQALWPNARIVPILVAPGVDAVGVGEAVGGVLCDWADDVVGVGSTDLTHYGPHYHFTPHGVGEKAHRWSRNENDAAFIQKLVELDPQGCLEEGLSNYNACCPGAAAAAVTSARLMGSEYGELLTQATSYEVMNAEGDPIDFVGYASVLF